MPEYTRTEIVAGGFLLAGLASLVYLSISLGGFGFSSVARPKRARGMMTRLSANSVNSGSNCTIFRKKQEYSIGTHNLF